MPTVVLILLLVTTVGISPASAITSHEAKAATHPPSWYSSNTTACDKAVKSGRVITAKTYNTCWNGAVRGPAPCYNLQTMTPTGQAGQVVIVGKREALLHVGEKPVYIPLNATATDENQGCKTP